MSANPRLTQVPGQGLVPLPYDTERLLLSREVDFSMNGVQTQTGRWSARGHLFLSNLRLILTTEKEDSSGESGLRVWKHRLYRFTGIACFLAQWCQMW